MAKGFLIRAAVREDGALLANVAGAIAGEVGVPFVVGRDDVPLRDPQAGYRARGGECWVVVMRDTIVGSLGVIRDADGALRLTHWFLAADLRGLGMGGLLLEEAFRFARTAGVPALRAAFLPVCRTAQAVLKVRGFHPEDAASENLCYEFSA